MRKSLLVLAFLIIVGCRHPDPTGYKIFGIEKLGEIKQNPHRYAGKLYAFGGRAVDVEKKDDETRFRILVKGEKSSETENSADNSLFVVYPSGKTTVAAGHYIKVLGYVREASIGKSLFGTKVTSLTLDAIAVYDTFTGFPFRLSRDEELFRKWQTGEPLDSDGG